METIELQLDAQTLARLQEMATARQISVQALLQETIARLSGSALKDDPLWGLFAEDAELLDQIVEEAMRARESRPLRTAGG